MAQRAYPRPPISGPITKKNFFLCVSSLTRLQYTVYTIHVQSTCSMLSLIYCMLYFGKEYFKTDCAYVCQCTSVYHICLFVSICLLFLVDLVIPRSPLADLAPWPSPPLCGQLGRGFDQILHSLICNCRFFYWSMYVYEWLFIGMYFCPFVFQSVCMLAGHLYSCLSICT